MGWDVANRIVFNNDFILQIIWIISTSRPLVKRTVKKILFWQMMSIIWISQFHGKKMIQYNNIHWSASGMNSLFKGWHPANHVALNHPLSGSLVEQTSCKGDSPEQKIIGCACFLQKISNTTILVCLRQAFAFFHSVASFAKSRFRTTTISCCSLQRR